MATFRKLRSGKWQAQIRRQGIKSLSKTFAFQADAKRWARTLESEIDRGSFVDRSEAEHSTVADLIDRYLREVTPRKKSARREAQRLSALRKHFGSYSLASVRSSHVAAYRDARIAAGKAGATVVKELNTLSHLFDVAARDWGISVKTNPAKMVSRPKVARGRDRRLVQDEETRLLTVCDASRAPMLGAAVRLALETAMRMGEILSLSWPDVDLRERVANLRETKTGDSRQVPLSTAAVAVLSSLPRHIGNPRVFWCWSRPDSLENTWRRAVMAAGIANLRFHDLRHEAVSRLFERGLNPMEVAAISGHRTLQMLKRYTHLRAADLVKKLA